MHKEYFEGILQLRNAENDVIDFVNREVSKRRNVRISKIVKSKNGIDMYFTSQHYLKALGKKLQRHFRGEMNISPRLFGKSKTGKNLYRVNLLFRQAKFKRGDIVMYRGNKLKIVKLGNKVFCKYIDTGKSITLSYNSLI